MTGFGFLWAKTHADGDRNYHPLPLHLIDVAVCAAAILEREPAGTRERMGDVFGLSWTRGRPWVLLSVACHDLGKASPGFQCKWPPGKELLRQAGIKLPRCPDTSVYHAFVSQIAVARCLRSGGWADESAARVAEALGAHHGTRATATELYNLEGNRNGLGDRQWEGLRNSLFSQLQSLFGAEDVPTKQDLTGPDFMLLAGLISYADWIGSNEEWFAFGTEADCEATGAWLHQRRTIAERALDAIGWTKRTALLAQPQSFVDVFPGCSPPRPLQRQVEQTLAEVRSPCAILIEAPMGEGKTEAAFYAHLEMQRRFGHRGLYIALPTKATGNAMYERTLRFLRGFAGERILDLQLLHGAALLNEVYQELTLTGVGPEAPGATVRAGQWFTYKKRALLSEYGVGTVDQALMTILPVRHYFVRLWGLANRVVVFDEIHAYDAYTGTLLFHLIAWLRALGSTVILLSATLPPGQRRQLARWLGATLPATEAPYPRLTVLEGQSCRQVSFASAPARRREVGLVGGEPDLCSIRTFIDGTVSPGGYGAVVVNTVQRAQELYQLYGEGELLRKGDCIVGKRLPDGTHVHLFHARYPACDRQKREDEVLAVYGRSADSGATDERVCTRHVLIATQVVEQSLDLDFDVLVTDLAPIDLVLQRAGRLWRHQRGDRPLGGPLLCIAGVIGAKCPDFGEPLWWDKIYREDILLVTHAVLMERVRRGRVVLPDEIDGLVREVYEGLPEANDDELRERLSKAEIEQEGLRCAQQQAAHQAIIGLPNDASWKSADAFYLFDEAEPGVNRTLIGPTRLGDDSVTAIPLFAKDGFQPTDVPDSELAKAWAARAVSLSRRSVVRKLATAGTPDAWRQSALLRNSCPLVLDDKRMWTEDDNVRLDEELGIVYTPKEVK